MNKSDKIILSLYAIFLTILVHYQQWERLIMFCFLPLVIGFLIGFLIRKI